MVDAYSYVIVDDVSGMETEKVKYLTRELLHESPIADEAYEFAEIEHYFDQDQFLKSQETMSVLSSDKAISTPVISGAVVADLPEVKQTETVTTASPVKNNSSYLWVLVIVIIIVLITIKK